MTTDEMRIAIAEKVGWKKVPVYEWEGNTRVPFQYVDLDVVPNYPTDLNACHEMENVLNREQQDVFANELYQLLPCDENHGPIDMDDPAAGDVMTASMFQVSHATAAERAEAFCRVFWPEKFKP